ncbi:hypothetical protein ACFRJ9_01050 [Paenarthrobacter sp. NPDC056912]|uniref:hypothetical protein n=1 Tax=Paenarthrobacter sp. NPDC056912 TaxID=3345965 RepID=UPI00366E2D88
MSTPYEIRTLTEDILARASEDWVSPFEVIRICKRSGLRNEEDLLDLAIGIIARMLTRGLLLAGDIESKVGHRPWNCDSGQAMSRIIEEWCAYPNPFDVPLGEIAWFAVTSEGRRIGESVWRRESE